MDYESRNRHKPRYKIPGRIYSRFQTPQCRSRRAERKKHLGRKLCAYTRTRNDFLTRDCFRGSGRGNSESDHPVRSLVKVSVLTFDTRARDERRGSKLKVSVLTFDTGVAKATRVVEIGW